jgi:hypothetical protein
MMTPTKAFILAIGFCIGIATEATIAPLMTDTRDFFDKTIERAYREIADAAWYEAYHHNTSSPARIKAAQKLIAACVKAKAQFQAKGIAISDKEDD